MNNKSDISPIELANKIIEYYLDWFNSYNDYTISSKVTNRMHDRYWNLQKN
jgi:hypothetical protein